MLRHKLTGIDLSEIAIHVIRLLRGKLRTFFVCQQKTGIFDDPAAIEAREGLIGLCTINRLKAIKEYKVIYS